MNVRITQITRITVVLLGLIPTPEFYPACIYYTWAGPGAQGAV